MKELFFKIFKYYFYMIVIFFIGRLGLFLLYFDSFSNSGINYWLSFIYGLKMDTIVSCIFLVIPTVLLTIGIQKLGHKINIFLKYYFLIVFCFIIYIEIATYPFIFQYDVRPNYLFIEYLDYPKEVFSMLFKDYLLEIIISVFIISIFTFFYIKNFKKDFLTIFEINYKKRVLLCLPLLCILFIGIRSSFGHRGANISDAMYSTNRIINEISKNSLHSIGYAIYVNNKHGTKNLMKRYGKMNINEALFRVKNFLKVETNKYSLKRKEESHFKLKKPKNLVIFIQESLGYQFVESVGGEKNITPNFNKLSKEGILFQDLYSNGTRSVRGIAGLVSGNFSIPGRGVVKRNKSQKDYFTIAKLLKPYGYNTSFIYGGESRFDNMKGWFLGNSFDEIIDETNFINPSFVGTWGVSDEDLVLRANEEYKKLYKKGQKFASVIFSTSNHTPFDFPDNKISLIKNVPKRNVKNAVKYADFAIGKFIEKAKKEEYYKNTIFVIVADHNVRVYGKDLVPIDMFKIPALIIGGGIKPLKYKNIATQPDVLATALDLLGIDLEYPIMGNSIFSNKKQNFALMQFNDYYALRKDDKVSISRPNKKALTFLYKNKKLIPTSNDNSLEKDLLAFIISLNYLYDKKLYQ